MVHCSPILSPFSSCWTPGSPGSAPSQLCKGWTLWMDMAWGAEQVGRGPPPPVPADPALALGAHVGWQCGKGTLQEWGRELGDPQSPPDPPPCTPKPHQLLEGEAAAVAQQGDVGSFALSPGDRDKDRDTQCCHCGGLGAGVESWSPPCPRAHPAPGCSKISVGSRANSSSARAKGSLRGARLLPKSPEPPIVPPTHPLRCPGRRGRGGSAGTRCWPWPAPGSASPPSCSHNGGVWVHPNPPQPQYPHRDPRTGTRC